MSTNVASGNGLVVVTHVYREQDLNGDAPPNVAVPPSLLGNGRQRAVPPQNGATHPFVAQFIHLLEPVMRDQTTVGTVQLLIGVIVFLFGIVRAAENEVLSAKSGVMFWGSVIHAAAGYITVQAKKNPSQSLDKTLLRMNILSSLTAVVAIALYSVDFTWFYHWRTELTGHGISGIMIVFSVTEFLISAAVSVFAYCGIYSSAQEMVSSQRAQYLPPSYDNVSSFVNTSETKVFPSVVSPSFHTYDKPEDLPSTA